jgi:hypothetical protein
MSAGAARKFDPPAPDPEGRTPESFLEEIQEILNSGTLRGAREVAEQGLALFPDHPELRRMHHWLRPYWAGIPPRNRPQDQEASHKWLSENAYTYRNRAVALVAGRLIAVSESSERLYELVRDRDPENIFFGRIYS